MSTFIFVSVPKSEKDMERYYIDLVIEDLASQTFYKWNSNLKVLVRKVAGTTATPAELSTFEDCITKIKRDINQTLDLEEGDEDEDIETVVMAAKVSAEAEKQKLRRARDRINNQEPLLTDKAKKLLCKAVEDPNILVEYWKFMPWYLGGGSHNQRGYKRKEGLLDLLEKLLDAEEVEGEEGLDKEEVVADK